jgi:glutaredoxin
MTNRILLAAALLALAGAVHAQLYRWVDDKGKVHFGDTPPSAAKGVQKGGEARPAAKSAAGAPAVAPNEPFELQLARKNHPVTLYSMPDCGAGCDEARSHLNRRGVPFAEISITDNDKFEEFKKTTGATGVPVMLVGSSIYKGFEALAYSSALDAAGYPKTGVLPPRKQAAPAAPAPTDKLADAPKPEEEQKPRGPYAPGGSAATPAARKR